MINEQSLFYFTYVHKDSYQPHAATIDVSREIFTTSRSKTQNYVTFSIARKELILYLDH